MDLQTVLTEVDSWSVGDRIRLLNELWDRLAEAGQEPGLSDEQKAELDHRLAEDDAAPDDVVSWDVVKARLSLGFKDESVGRFAEKGEGRVRRCDRLVRAKRPGSGPSSRTVSKPYSTESQRHLRFTPPSIGTFAELSYASSRTLSITGSRPIASSCLPCSTTSATRRSGNPESDQRTPEHRRPRRYELRPAFGLRYNRSYRYDRWNQE